ncbi:hypothetical protein [Paractinoplanes hotanensis]|uniref:Uncharacterized protein n=1 Tax=Paractinoplanes hotanensis TaxID=2906497 RepID=A0ABT0YE94_9ACTN|nr:hypothetical protein [Actinoplanes hotanensis]MCM4083569.1 hypothetical protein [Actinoplanes hotanensis]
MHERTRPTETTRHLHRLLGRLGSHFCDGFVEDLRTRLVEGHLVEVAQAVVFAVVAEPLDLTDPEVDLLIDTLTGQGEDTAMAQTLRRAGRSRPSHRDLVGPTDATRALV